MVKYLAAILMVTVTMHSCALLPQSAADRQILQLDMQKKHAEELKVLKSKEQQAQRKREKRYAIYDELRKKYPDVVPDLRQTDKIPTATTFAAEYDLQYLNTIFFADDSSYLNDVQQLKLDSIVREYFATATLDEATQPMDTPIITTVKYILVEGHSDTNVNEIESVDKRALFNSRIAGRRAVRTLEYIIHKGVPEERIFVYAHGSLYPARDSDTPANRSFNRRVEVRIVAESDHAKLQLGEIGTAEPVANVTQKSVGVAAQSAVTQ